MGISEYWKYISYTSESFTATSVAATCRAASPFVQYLLPKGVANRVMGHDAEPTCCQPTKKGLSEQTRPSPAIDPAAVNTSSDIIPTNRVCSGLFGPVAWSSSFGPEHTTCISLRWRRETSQPASLTATESDPNPSVRTYTEQ